MSARIGNAQHIGSRDRQEDYFLSKKIGNMDLAVLADGMGGYEGGDQASSTVTQGFISFIEQQERKYSQIPGLLVDAAFSANAQLARLKQSTESNMGSTLVSVLVRDNHAWWVSIGDSLLYLWRDGNLQKLNADHSHYQDLRQQVFLGQISTAQAANDPERDGLTSALMGRQMKHVDVSRFGIELKDGDIFLLASDGLETIYATQGEQTAQIKATLQRLFDPQQIADTLVQQVLRVKAEHQDNVSVLTIRVNLQEGAISHVQAGNTAKQSWFNNSPLMLLTGLLLGGLVSIVATQVLFKPAPTPMTTPSPSPMPPPVAGDDKGEPQKITCEDEQKRVKEVCESVFADKSKSLPFCRDIAEETKKRCENNFSNESESSNTGAAVIPNTDANKKDEDSVSIGDKKVQPNNTEALNNGNQQPPETTLPNDRKQQTAPDNNPTSPPSNPLLKDKNEPQVNDENINQPTPVAPQSRNIDQQPIANGNLYTPGPPLQNNNGFQQFNGMYTPENNSLQVPAPQLQNDDGQPFIPNNDMPPLPEIPSPSDLGEQQPAGIQQNQPEPTMQQGNDGKSWWQIW
ncbi:MAG: protein phosphatase 2C domain-containing protein [Gammaproteobacteria bacterium]|nr:protein phosphatase 2C domain-containing protein [Gammaproteobacteria bacterium]MBU1724981.1 protein phosphatase 2C domain-containing protein [Gammaproteobacteria bacterium]MBU2007091.1 protein phosphatase 2C domain-containing protein [Gammaproteobacteria bacterium]